MKIIHSSAEVDVAINQIHQHIKANPLPESGVCEANAVLVITAETYEKYSAELSYDMKLDFLGMCNADGEGQLFDVQ